MVDLSRAHAQEEAAPPSEYFVPTNQFKVERSGVSSFIVSGSQIFDCLIFRKLITGMFSREKLMFLTSLFEVEIDGSIDELFEHNRIVSIVDSAFQLYVQKLDEEVMRLRAAHYDIKRKKMLLSC